MRVVTRTVPMVCLLALGLVWACGGKAVIDDPNASGSGGAGGTASSSSQSPLCGTPDPIGALEFCGGSVGVGAGDSSCSTVVCDQNDNSWESECDVDGCRCKYNGLTECTCFSDGELCGSAPSCCPSPFPQ